MNIDERVALSDRLAEAADWLEGEYHDETVAPAALTDGPITHDALLAYCARVMREAAKAVVPEEEADETV
jgi:hypothetical protein